MAKKKTYTPKSDIDLTKFLQEIECRAFERYLERLRESKEGNELSDWLEAEAEIKAKYGM